MQGLWEGGQAQTRERRQQPGPASHTASGPSNPAWAPSSVVWAPSGGPGALECLSEAKCHFRVAEHGVKIVLLVVLWDLLHGRQPLGGGPGERHRHRDRGRLHHSGADQCREKRAAVGFRGVAVVLGAAFGRLQALVAAALGTELGAWLQGVVAAPLVVASWAHATPRVLEVGIGGPGCNALLVDRGVGLAREMASSAI
ncbi:hypothetical protein EYF80_037317 [Liparis tanakae]|uniref:Uncharacterized protein n=1 Tax=Liparis tanakae TaxID=230148 RepID=A0A4Z2GGR9_9TELE|nr:hypothetical protein EYF80_037317 [Liparis tanakae]